ncbi:MAG: DUF1028 domain-containing protein [Candidatus Bathyarchaeota archaeon]|nr:DUF1028 domain-containing protein [Candidatus Bathyarchaeota archaeon]
MVAFDPSTRDLGVAVQSRYFSVGSVVPWAEADVGAIATQSFVNVSYGPRGLQLLKQGLTVEEVIDKLTRDDEAREFLKLELWMLMVTHVSSRVKLFRMGWEQNWQKLCGSRKHFNKRRCSDKNSAKVRSNSWRFS